MPQPMHSLLKSDLDRHNELPLSKKSEGSSHKTTGRAINRLSHSLSNSFLCLVVLRCMLLDTFKNIKPFQYSKNYVRRACGSIDIIQIFAAYLIVKHLATAFIDLFYPPFRRLMPLRTFRYAACGGFNTLFGLSVYYVCLRYIFSGQTFDFGFYAFKPHTASLFVSGLASFIMGFALNKYVVFVESYLRGRVQLFRYALAFGLNIFINWLILKLMVEYLYWDAFLSQVVTTVLVAGTSYLVQRHFTFKS